MTKQSIVLYKQNNFHNGWCSLLPVLMTEAIQMMTGSVQNMCTCMEACLMQKEIRTINKIRTVVSLDGMKGQYLYSAIKMPGKLSQ